MSIIQEINQDEFIDIMVSVYNNSNFSYKGKIALYEYLKQYSEDLGQDLKLDPVTLCCEYTENNIIDLGWKYGHPFDNCLPKESQQEHVKKWLQDRTVVIEVDKETVIIQDF